MTQIYIGMVLRNGQCGGKTEKGAPPPRLIKSGCLLHSEAGVLGFLHLAVNFASIYLISK